MRGTLVDLALQVRLFLVDELRKFRRVVAEWMRQGNRELLLLCRLAPLPLWRFQLGAHHRLLDLLFDGSAQLTGRIATDGTADDLKQSCLHCLICVFIGIGAFLVRNGETYRIGPRAQ